MAFGIPREITDALHNFEEMPADIKQLAAMLQLLVEGQSETNRLLQELVDAEVGNGNVFGEGRGRISKTNLRAVDEGRC